MPTSTVRLVQFAESFLVHDLRLEFGRTSSVLMAQKFPKYVALTCPIILIWLENLVQPHLEVSLYKYRHVRLSLAEFQSYSLTHSLF